MNLHLLGSLSATAAKIVFLEAGVDIDKVVFHKRRTRLGVQGLCVNYSCLKASVFERLFTHLGLQ